MTYVGLDQSYTGFGYSANGISKKKLFPKTKYPKPVDRLFAVEEWLEEWLRSLYPISLVAMEGYANAAKFGREMAGELGWAVKRSIFVTTGQHPLIVPPNSLKKFVTGKGSGGKNVMLLHVHKKWGEEFSDDNVADAYALEKFGEAYDMLINDKPLPRGREKSYVQYEFEAVKAVRKKVQEDGG